LKEKELDSSLLGARCARSHGPVLKTDSSLLGARCARIHGPVLKTDHGINECIIWVDKNWNTKHDTYSSYAVFVSKEAVVTLKKHVANGPSKWLLHETAITVIHPRLLTQIYIDTLYPENPAS
jgi:hypothetical protein